MVTKKQNHVPSTNETLKEFLSGWNNMARQLPKLTEDEVAKMLHMERNDRRRMPIMLRLHQRLCKLRMERERKELFGE